MGVFTTFRTLVTAPMDADSPTKDGGGLGDGGAVEDDTNDVDDVTEDTDDESGVEAASGEANGVRLGAEDEAADEAMDEAAEVVIPEADDEGGLVPGEEEGAPT